MWGEAALCEPLSCSAYAVNQTGMGMEDTVVVSGLGAIGMGIDVYKRQGLDSYFKSEYNEVSNE